VSGFLNYDEALQYARQLYAHKGMAGWLARCRRIIISEDNLKLLGTKYSYADYERFFEKSLAPLHISSEKLLNNPKPADIVTGEEAGDGGDGSTGSEDSDGGDRPEEGNGAGTQNTDIDFDDDFYR